MKPEMVMRIWSVSKVKDALELKRDESETIFIIKKIILGAEWWQWLSENKLWLSVLLIKKVLFVQCLLSIQLEIYLMGNDLKEQCHDI